jgi:hypothetical protein
MLTTGNVQLTMADFSKWRTHVQRGPEMEEDELPLKQQQSGGNWF